ncbi:TetR family transcriptional regulator [Nocardioides aquiterrae]|uniref:TetR family transcriptional regulator n=1 Tax=Nocardioides aquiterrae TaxID=203799 RepID=A0ABN1UFB3_9ACTN
MQRAIVEPPSSQPVDAHPGPRLRDDTVAEADHRGSASGRTGRRPGQSTTRAAIAAAALHQFAARGYGGATMRSIAQQAGVDPALIAYFFGSKRDLFNQVMRLPIDPPRVVSRVLDGERTAVGERLATVTFEVLADQHNRDTVIGLLRSASHDREAATLLRVAVTEEILKPIASGLDVSDADLRAELALSQISGLVFARHVIGLETLGASAPTRLRRTLGLTLQRCLVGPLDT